MPTKVIAATKAEKKDLKKKEQEAVKVEPSRKRKHNEIANHQQTETSAKPRSRSKTARNSGNAGKAKKSDDETKKFTAPRSARSKEAAKASSKSVSDEASRKGTNQSQREKPSSQKDELLNVKDILGNGESSVVEDDGVSLEVQKIKRQHDQKRAEGDKAMANKLIKFDQVYSIFGLVENYPNKFKEVLDELVACPDDEEANSDKTVLKTVILYFLELLGVSKDEDLKDLVEKSLGWTKEQEVDKFFKDRKPEALINFDTLQLFSVEKGESNHKKFFKRFCKIIVTDLVDMYPKRSNLLSAIVDKVCIMAQSKIRLVRFGFTFIALGLTKVLLHQFNDLSSVICRLRSQPTLSRENDTMITRCHDMIKEQLQLLSLEVLQERVYDPQEFIRKHVLECIAQFDATEIKAANDIKEMKLIDLVFESLRDESAPIRKLALQILSQMLIKYHQRENLDQGELAKYFKKQKLQLVRLTQPVLTSQAGDQLQTDPQVMLKAIQVLEKMLEIIPEEGILDQDCISKITNLAHFPDRKIREEVGHFMILLSDEIDDPASLLEVQKFNLNKIENQNAGAEELDHRAEINFTAEPRKSKKQLQKLMNIVETYCKSKAEIRKALNAEDSHYSEAMPSKQHKSDSEGELAQLVLEIYGRKTSVVYDLSAITELMQQNIEAKKSSDSKLKLLANLLYFSLANIYQNKSNQCSIKDFQVSFDQYWRLALSHLSLKRINELLQPSRTNFGVVEPILKTLFLICQAKAQSLGPQAAGGNDAASEDNESQVCQDLMHVLRDLIAKEQQNMNIVKLSIINLVKLKDIYPKFKDQSLLILRELIESLQELMKRQFEIPGAAEDKDQIIQQPSGGFDVEMVVLNCKKFNQMMSSVSLVSMISSQQVREWSQYIIAKVFGLLEQQSIVDRMSEEQIGVMLMLPLESLKQLYYQRQAGAENREEVSSQIAVSSELLDRILALFESPAIKACPERQLQVFKSLVGSLEIITGDNSLGHQSLFDLRSYSKIQEMIISVINSASRPYFYSDQMTLDYFQSLMSLVGQNTEAFMSQVGIEFVINFTLNYHHSSGSSVGVNEGSHTVSGKIQTQLKRLLHVQKTRDAVVPIGSRQSADQDPHETPAKQAERAQKYRSIFYSFVLRCISQLLKGDDTGPQAENSPQLNTEKLLQFLHTTKSDVITQMKTDCKLPTSDKALVVQFMRSKAIQIVLKSVLSAIMMAVMSKRQSNISMTQKQEEQTYCQFIEDFLNYSFMKQVDGDGSDSYPNLLLLACIPQLMHGAFVSQPMQLKILGKMKDIISKIGEDALDQASSLAPAQSNQSLKAVKEYISTLIKQQITKVEQNQKGQQTKAAAEPQPKAEETDLKTVKNQIGMGRKRTYADKSESHADDNQDSEYIDSGKGRTARIEPRKQRQIK